MDQLPVIIQVAAWIYVLKHILPFVVLPVILVICYFGFRFTGMSHKDTMNQLKESVMKGVIDALKNYD